MRTRSQGVLSHPHETIDDDAAQAAALDRFEQAPPAPADPGDQVADVRYGFGDRPTY